MKNLLILMMLVGALSSCGSKTERLNEDQEMEVDAENLAILNGYIELKDDLVAGNFEEAKSRSEELKSAVLNNPPSNNEAILMILDDMNNAASIDEIRTGFDPLSQEIYTWAKGVDKGDITLYWQYCPMAKDNQGANWLSLDSEIMNPYFGDQMLHCGNIEEQL